LYAAPGILTAVAAKEPWTVEKVVGSIPGGAPVSHSESPVPFFHMLERLKTTKREGWRRFGIDRYVRAYNRDLRDVLTAIIEENPYPTICIVCR
jgi:hypothetical protein